MIRKYIIVADDSIKGFDNEIARLEREWGAEEIEPCDECINRQEVNVLVDELARAISDERGCISRGRSTATILQDILNLPPVTPQQTELEKKYNDGYNDGYDDGYEDAEEIFS